MKRMWDKPELVKLIEDNAPEITVDDALSGTSENPVQNKVINTALGTKQDSLPSTTGEEGKFLKVGSSGLEWASAGGGKYLHIIRLSSTLGTGEGILCVICSESSTAYTTETLNTYLSDHNYTASAPYPASSLVSASTNGTNLFRVDCCTGLYPYDTSGVRTPGIRTTFTLTTDGSSITVSKSNTDNFISVYVRSDEVRQL